MSDSYNANCAEAAKVTKHKYTFEDISARFRNYMRTQKPGIQRFYKEDHCFKDAVGRGMAMTRKLMEGGCPAEEAAALSVLALWDLVLFIDNSISMGMEEGGARDKTLIDVLTVTAAVYSYAKREGFTAVRFLNTPEHYSNVTPQKIDSLTNRIVYEGLTPLGTKLKERVLDNHVPRMKKPLLVMILSDAEITGEAEGVLDNVILTQALKLTQANPPRGADALAYQFVKIGNDKVAETRVAALDRNPHFGRYVDSSSGKYKLDNIRNEPWKIIPKLFLGAISHWWDTEAITYHEEVTTHDCEITLPLHLEAPGDLEEVDAVDVFTGGKLGKSTGGFKDKIKAGINGEDGYEPGRDGKDKTGGRGQNGIGVMVEGGHRHGDKQEHVDSAKIKPAAIIGGATTGDAHVPFDSAKNKTAAVTGVTTGNATGSTTKPTDIKTGGARGSGTPDKHDKHNGLHQRGM